MRQCARSVALAGLLVLCSAAASLAADMVGTDEILKQLESMPKTQTPATHGGRGVRISPSTQLDTAPQPQAAPAPAARPSTEQATPKPEPKPVQQAVPPTRETGTVANATKAERPSVTVYLYFKSGSADLADEFSRRQLAALGKALASPALAGARFEIGGYTDSVGSDSLNLALSTKRAEHIRQMLVSSYGLAAERIESKGYGKNNPVAGNETEAGRAKNRRVVIKRLD